VFMLPAQFGGGQVVTADARATIESPPEPRVQARRRGVNRERLSGEPLELAQVELKEGSILLPDQVDDRNAKLHTHAPSVQATARRWSAASGRVGSSSTSPSSTGSSFRTGRATATSSARQIGNPGWSASSGTLSIWP